MLLRNEPARRLVLVVNYYLCGICGNIMITLTDC